MKTLEDKIMDRVYRLYILRRVFHPTLLKVYVALSCVLFVASLVSIHHVIENMPTVFAISDVFAFVRDAFINTEVSVKIFLIGVLISLALLLRDGIEFLRANMLPPQSV